MADLPKRWFPDHIDGVIDPLAQSLLYPYPAPIGDYYMRDGLPVEAPEGIEPDNLVGRVPVLSVGSNRAPLQLRRKFGPEACLPVTACRLINADVVFAASLSFYCAMPATACPSPGTVAQLNITWLDADQLAHMHDTEALGIAYDFVQIDRDIVDHGNRKRAGVFNQPVFGYQARAGVFANNGMPVAQAGIPATGRQFLASDQMHMLAMIMGLMGEATVSLEDWILHLRDSRSARDDVMTMLADRSMTPPDQPWHVVEAQSQNAEKFL